LEISALLKMPVRIISESLNSILLAKYNPKILNNGPITSRDYELCITGFIKSVALSSAAL
jgi:hypothetical protein